MQIKITIKPQDPRFLLVEIDGEHWKEINKSAFKPFIKLLLPCTNKQELETVWPSIERKAIENCVVYLLSRKGYFSKELETLLVRKKFSLSSIASVIDRYIELGYINDEREREHLIAREQRKGRGPYRIAHQLKAFDVDSDVRMDQKAAITKLLSTRFSRFNLKDRQEKQKVVRALQRRGFDFELISALLYKPE